MDGIGPIYRHRDIFGATVNVNRVHQQLQKLFLQHQDCDIMVALHKNLRQNCFAMIIYKHTSYQLFVKTNFFNIFIALGGLRNQSHGTWDISGIINRQGEHSNLAQCSNRFG